MGKIIELLGVSLIVSILITGIITIGTKTVTAVNEHNATMNEYYVELEYYTE